MRTLDTQMMKMADNQQEVKGTYHGKPFSGIVVSSRQITTRPYREEVTIRLTAPFSLWGVDDSRETILISADGIEDGTHTIVAQERPAVTLAIHGGERERFSLSEEEILKSLTNAYPGYDAKIRYDEPGNPRTYSTRIEVDTKDNLLSFKSILKALGWLDYRAANIIY